jgi:hypothetical protein
MNRSRRALLATGGIAATLALTAARCGTASPPVAEAAAWMAQHPAAERPGWVNAMILPGGSAVVGFAGAAARQACPGIVLNPVDPVGIQVAAYRVPAAGGLPGCGAWTATALTTAGQVVRLACGSIPARVECPLFRYADGYIPFSGDYVRVRPGGGQVTGRSDVQVIEEFADMSPSLMEPDPGGPVFATTPAGGGR